MAKAYITRYDTDDRDAQIGLVANLDYTAGEAHTAPLDEGFYRISIDAEAFVHVGAGVVASKGSEHWTVTAEPPLVHVALGERISIVALAAAADFVASPLPQAMSPSTASIAVGDAPGAFITAITGVPPGAKLSGRPLNGLQDGMVVVSGNATDGWGLAVGPVTTRAPGAIAFVLEAKGALPTTVAIEIRAAGPVATVDLDFIAGVYTAAGATTTPSANFSTTRNDTAYALDAAGIYQAFTTGQLRITSRGLRGEPAKTNLCRNSMDLSQATWSVASGATKATLAGMRGPFKRIEVTATTAARDSRINDTLQLALTAGNEYAMSCLYEPGTSGNIFLRLQQAFGSFVHSNVCGKIGEPLGAGNSGAGDIYDVVTTALASDLYMTTFIFRPAATGNHQLGGGPGTLTNGQSVILLGFQAEQDAPTSIIATTTAPVTRAADALTAIGPLAAALEAAQGTVILDVDDLGAAAGDVLAGGAADAVKFIQAVNSDELSSAGALGTGGGSGSLKGVSTLIYEWNAAGWRLFWNGGLAAEGASAPAAHAGMHFLSGVSGFIRRVRVYDKRLAMQSASALAGWRPMPSAGNSGGYITRIHRAADGRIYIATDVHSAYCEAPGEDKFTDIVTSKTMPLADCDLLKNGGVSEIVTAPSDPGRAYMLKTMANLANAPTYLYRRDTVGGKWRLMTAFAAVTDMNANRAERLGGPYIAVDPVKPDHVIVGTPGELRRSTNGFNTMSVLAWAGAANATGFGVAFDPSSAVSEGQTQGVYIFKGGTGLFKSLDAGVSGAAVTGSPATFVRMTVGGDGSVYVCPNNGTGNIYRMPIGSSTMTAVHTNGGSGNASAAAIAVDPANPSRVAIVAKDTGQISISTDKAATFGGLSLLWMRAAPKHSWKLFTNATYLSCGDLMFDTDGYLWLAEGMGVWRTKPGVPNTACVVWEDKAEGIYELVANYALSLPGGPLLTFNWDRPVFRNVNPEAPARRHGPDTNNAILHGWHGDYAPANPSFVAMIANKVVQGVVTDRSGYSSDGGKTWTPYASMPAPVGANGKIAGVVAVSTDDNHMMAPGMNAPLYYTANKGGAWAASVIPDASQVVGQDNGWTQNSYGKLIPLVSSRVTPGKFFAVNRGTGVSQPGVYRSTDGGANMARVLNQALPGAASANAKLGIKPFTDDELFFCGGVGGLSTVTAPGAPANKLMRAVAGSGGTDWVEVERVSEVWFIRWGKAAPGSSYLTAYMLGYVDGVFGSWMSIDGEKSWRPYGGVGADFFPLDSLDNPSALEADINRFGRAFMGRQGSGWIYRDT